MFQKQQEQRNSQEIAKRLIALSEKHKKLRLEVQVLKESPTSDVEDITVLEKYVDKVIREDGKIQEEYSNPLHPYWEYKCAQYGIDTFNLRLLCPEQFLPFFTETYLGCFCTKYKTYMLDVWNNSKEITTFIEQANRIGHPFELVFVPEGQEDIVEQISKVIQKPKIVIWINSFIQNPSTEERKDFFRNKMRVNALGREDLRALYFPPQREAGLRDSLTGFDMWMDLVCTNNLVKINYQDERYYPSYRFVATRGLS